MSIKNLTLSFAIVALGIASAASSTYRLTLARASMVGNTELKAGDYKMEVDGDKVTIKSGKNTVNTATVKVENGDQKFAQTTIRYDNSDHVQEIRVGGTKTKLVFVN